MKFPFTLLFLLLFSLTVSSQTYRELSEKAIDYIEEDSLAQAEDFLVQAMKLEPSNPHNALLFSNLVWCSAGWGVMMMRSSRILMH